MRIAVALRALANERRLQILEWLREPRKHFREQVDGDLVEDGVCGLLIAEKLGVSVKTVESHREHIKNKLALGSHAELVARAANWLRENGG